MFNDFDPRQLQRLHVVITKLKLDKDRKEPIAIAENKPLIEFAIDKPEKTRNSLEQLHASGTASALQPRQFQHLHLFITKLNLDKDRKALLELKHQALLERKSQAKPTTSSSPIPRARLQRLQSRQFQRLQRLQTWQVQRLHVVITKLKLDKDRKALKERKSLANSYIDLFYCL